MKSKLYQILTWGTCRIRWWHILSSSFLACGCGWCRCRSSIRPGSKAWWNLQWHQSDHADAQREHMFSLSFRSIAKFQEWWRAVLSVIVANLVKTTHMYKHLTILNMPALRIWNFQNSLTCSQAESEEPKPRLAATATGTTSDTVPYHFSVDDPWKGHQMKHQQ